MASIERFNLSRAEISTAVQLGPRVTVAGTAPLGPTGEQEGGSRTAPGATRYF
jgi:hypothetical protein